jgi:hypothetical protein
MFGDVCAVDARHNETHERRGDKTLEHREEKELVGDLKRDKRVHLLRQDRSEPVEMREVETLEALVDRHSDVEPMQERLKLREEHDKHQRIEQRSTEEVLQRYSERTERVMVLVLVLHTGVIHLKVN